VTEPLTLPYPDFVFSRQFLGPSWLVADGGDSQRIGFVVDVLKNAFAERMRQALLARFPQNDPLGVTTPPPDALAAIGRDRRIVRGFNESAVAYARRLIAWRATWKRAGNPFALMQQLSAYLGPGPAFRTVDVRGNWFSLNADGSMAALLNQANWDWDGAVDALTRWSRFWVVVYPNGLWTQQRKWGDGGKWGDGNTWGSTATVDQVTSMQGIVRDWKPAGTLCVNVILAFDNTTFVPTLARDATGLPNGTWGNWGTTIGGVFQPGRLASASYLDGV
jgi:hypothetical protein